MSEGRRIAPAPSTVQPAQPGPQLPYAYEKSVMDQRAATAQRIQHASQSPMAGQEHSDVLQIHQFVQANARTDVASLHGIGHRLIRGHSLKDAVLGQSDYEAQVAARGGRD